MSHTCADLYRRHCRPLEVQPTGETARLKKLDGVRGVLFDIYGTMFISGSGDVGVAQHSGPHAELDRLKPGLQQAGAVEPWRLKPGLQHWPADAWNAAVAAVGLTPKCDGVEGVDRLLATIRAYQAQARAMGIEYPEVDIIEVWRQCLGELADEQKIDGRLDAIDLRALAVHYEVRTNPVWPMPGLIETLSALRQKNMRLGLISNAQFYTLEMFRGLLDQTPQEMGLDPDLQFYSYRYLQAKPGDFLYELAGNALAKIGFEAENMVYVGNDMLNDIAAASRAGFRTALFAGDRRSLRWRTDDPRVAGVTPDLVLTDLRQLVDCVGDPVA